MFKQIVLPYGYDALEPVLDAVTVETHYAKHHAAYTQKLNEAAEKAGLQGMEIESILADWKSMACEQDDAVMTALRNNGGGFYSHNLYFGQLSPDGGGEPDGELAAQIAKDFGSFASFKEKISAAAKNQFGSGYAWLNTDTAGSLTISQTINQDTPILESEGTLYPIFCIDVWEHAYYLKYKNLRPDYVDAFFGIVNWQQVAENYAKAQSR